MWLFILGVIYHPSYCRISREVKTIRAVRVLKGRRAFYSFKYF